VCYVSVADAVVAMRDEMETSEHVRLAIRFHHISTLAKEFFLSTNKLKSFRRQALMMLRRRTTRQSRIRMFYRHAVIRRRVEKTEMVMHRWKLYVAKSKNCAVATKWIRQNRLDRLFASWRRNYSISRATTIHNAKWKRRHLHGAIYTWRIGLRDRKCVAQKWAMKEVYALRFRLRWIMFYWRANVRRSKLHLISHSNEMENGHSAPEIGFYSVEQIAARHFKHTLLLAWMKVSKRNRRQLLDRGAVLKTLYCRRLRDAAFALWRSTHIARRQWMRQTGRRGFKALRQVRMRKQLSRYALERGCQFFVFKIQLIALKRLYRNARVSKRLREKACALDEKHSLHVVIRALTWWSTFASLEAHRKEMAARAMGLYICHMTRKVWGAWKNSHVEDKQAKSVRKAIAAAEVDRERMKDGEDVLCRRKVRNEGRNEGRVSLEDEVDLLSASGKTGHLTEDINLRISLSGELLASLLGRDHGKVGIDAVSDDESEYTPSEFGSDLSSLDPPSPMLNAPSSSHRVYGKTMGRSRIAIATALARQKQEVPVTLPTLPHMSVRKVKAAACLSW
jgi:hypothetical protein